jgi:hypothetical protein
MPTINKKYSIVWHRTFRIEKSIHLGGITQLEKSALLQFQVVIQFPNCYIIELTQ